MGRTNRYCGLGYDCSFKLLLIGDSAVGKSSLLLSFVSDDFNHEFHQDLTPTIGVDFKIKFMSCGGKRLKLTIWDTAGQERFGTLTSSYYRGAHGIILVYDVTRRETYTSVSKTWMKELERYCTNPDCVKLLVGNKVDRDSERVVTTEEGMALAKEHGCLFVECSAKTQANVKNCFKELIVKILEKPSLLEKGSTPVKNQILKQKEVFEAQHSVNCCL
ncbi:ras-related protein RABC2a-like [Andrographis paniculata]|uniref:ras-related protein RABC2a-like n=1 Tax=Andrographis paniculata TaxID=175694 RepID=UPI0021E776CA|nr:ras-related protein RABC2a-like [Andrographis paniculata]